MKKTDTGVNLTIGSLSVKRGCMACSEAAPARSLPLTHPLMAPVMDTASEGFKDGRAAHLVKEGLAYPLAQSTSLQLRVNGLHGLCVCCYPACANAFQYNKK